MARELIAAVLFASATAYQISVEPVMYNGVITIEELSVAGNLDGAKFNTSANSTSFDYWWFDVVSAENDAALNIVFYNAGDIGNPQPLAVEVSGTFPNGTVFFNQVLEPTGAEISNGPEGISGVWRGLGASFRGTNLEETNVTYELNFDSLSALGLNGTVKLSSRAQAHYSCDPNVPGVTQLHLERFFWANAVPDADAVVDININGTALEFAGIGYHDKNWGDKTVLKSPKFWNWGHSRVGPYTVVWYDLLDRADNEYHRSYVARDGEVVSLSCGAEAVVTRPWGGEKVTWPPAGGLGSVAGVVSTFELDDGDRLVVNVTKERLTYDRGVYTRATGSSVGVLESTNETFTGLAFFDEFTYGVLYG